MCRATAALRPTRPIVRLTSLTVAHATTTGRSSKHSLGRWLKRREASEGRCRERQSGLRYKELNVDANDVAVFCYYRM